MKSIHRISALLLALVLMLSLVACSSEQPSQSNDSTNTPAATDSTTPSASDESAEPDNSAETPTGDSATISLPLVTEPTTLRFWWPSVNSMLEYDYSHASDYLYFREMEKRTGVTVEIEIPNEPSTQFGLMIASQDYPDFVENFGSYYTQGLDHAIEEELIVDLNDYAEYLPNLMAKLNGDELYRREAYTDGGHLPGIPAMADYSVTGLNGCWSGYVIRQDWLEELQMDVPTTYSELEELLGAMQANYDTAANPFYMVNFSGSYVVEMGHAFYAGYDVAADWYQVDGVVKYGPMEDGMKDYISMLRDWYVKGYINPDIMSDTYFVPSPSEAGTGEYGVFPIIYNAADSYVATNQADNPSYNLTPMPYLTINEGDELHIGPASEVSQVRSCVMADSENIELVCRWWDYFFSEEGILLGNFGIEGETFEYVDGEPVWMDSAFNKPDDVNWNLSTAQTMYFLYNTPGYRMPQNELFMVGEIGLECMDTWKGCYDNEHTYPAAVTMTLEESETYTSVMSDISTYVTEVFAKLFVGEMSFDEYDSFIADIEQMGIQQAIDVKQAALDRYDAR